MSFADIFFKRAVANEGVIDPDKKSVSFEDIRVDLMKELQRREKDLGIDEKFGVVQGIINAFGIQVITLVGKTTGKLYYYALSELLPKRFPEKVKSLSPFLETIEHQSKPVVLDPDVDYMAIKKLVDLGVPHTKIGRRFGVSATTIKRLVNSNYTLTFNYIGSGRAGATLGRKQRKTRQQLSESQRQELISLRKAGTTYTELAKKFNVSPNTAWKISKSNQKAK